MRILFIVTALSLVTPAAAQEKFTPNLPATSVHILSPGTTQADLDAQVKANNDYQASLRNGIISNGGCQAELRPVWVAEKCDYVAFGKPTEGGSE